jgi:chemotaxis protein MotA
MDPATGIGVGVGLVVIFVAQIMEGGNPASLLLVPPMLLVFGATFFVSMAGGTMADFKAAIAGLVKAFTAGAPSAVDVVPVIVTLADKARKEGLLALEESLKDVEDPFLVKGLTMAVDGTDPEEMREILEGEVAAKKAHAKQTAKFWADAGAYAPTIGIIGTVVGLVQVLKSLEDPAVLGPLVASAFVATLWGVLSANFVWLPISAKIRRNAELRQAQMQLILEGVCEILAGTNPRALRQKLRAMLPPSEAQLSAA